MKTLSLYIILVLFIYTATGFAQAPNFGSASGFALFTSSGAVPNTSVSTITGNIGTNIGAISGFEPPSTVNGNFHTRDDTTAQAAIDLLTAYNQLFNTATTTPGHAATFGTETLTAGVYGIPAAGSLAGTLILDAAGNSNAVFIFKFGGAFSVGAGATVILANGALAGNVFWIAEGAISMAANIVMKGSLIANNGANSLGAGSNLEGRMYSTTGAISTNSDTVTKPLSGGYIPLPVELLSFTGNCSGQNTVLKWTTATEINNLYFTVERSDDALKWNAITKIAGAVNSAVVRNYTFTERLIQKGNYYYRLKQTDLDEGFKYGPIIFIKNCSELHPKNIIIYPNPTTGKFTLKYGGNIAPIQFTEVLNENGKTVFKAKGTQTKIDLSDKAPGMYYLRLHTNTAIHTQKFIIIKHNL